MSPKKHNPPATWSLITLFIALSVTFILAAIYYYYYQKETLLIEKQKELSSISDLKIRQIIQWRNERFGDANLLYENSLLHKNIKELFQHPSNNFLRKEILGSLISLTQHSDYNNVVLISPEGNVILTYPDQDTLLGNHLKAFIPEIIKGRKVVLTDLHYTEKVNIIHLDLIIPLFGEENNEGPVFGEIALGIDPNKVIYPLIQAWPYTSYSAETFIIRNEGDSIVFLTELRHKKNQAITMKRSVLDNNSSYAMAVQGITGTIDAVDYRGERVVASMKQVPGSNWIMITKIDRREVLLSIMRQMTLTAIILALLIITSVLFLGFIVRNQRVRFYRDKYEDELERQALIRHFDYIVKFANDIILLLDKNLVIIEANDAALGAYKYTRKELIGMNLDNILASGVKNKVFDRLKLLENRESSIFETIHKRKDGSEFPLEINTRIVNIEGEKYYQTIARDIADRKHAEETLKESEEKFRKLFEESPFGMVMTDKDFQITKANKSFCKMTGYEEEELKSFTFRNLTDPEQISKDEVSLKKLVTKELPAYHVEKKYIRKDGTIIWGSTTINTIRNKNDELLYFMGMIEDVSLKKEAESELEKSLSLLKATLESSADGLLVVSLDGKVVQYNQKFADMWGIPKKVLETGEDRVLLEFVKDQLIDPDSFLVEVKNMYDEPDMVINDLLEFKDGRFFERYSLPQVINGKSVGRVWSFRDITEKKKAVADLIAAKEKAEESDRLKTSFLHNVSHEIRTPMNAIIGFSTLMNEKGLSDEERNQYSGIISQSGDQLLSLINDIVDIANIESGQVKLNIAKWSLNSALRTLNDQFNYKTNDILINLFLGLPDEKSFITTDGTKVIQILTNLLGNALKFTKYGRIDFGYVLKDSNLEFFVNDTGIGISPDHLEKIFDRFFQVDGANTRVYGGTGLGLSICKAYIGLLGGEIRVESEPGKGSRFFFTLPYKY